MFPRVGQLTLLLWCCQWGRGQRGNNVFHSLHSKPYLTTSSPVRLAVSPAFETPGSLDVGLYIQGFWVFSFLVSQPQPCQGLLPYHGSSPPICPSPFLLPFWMNVSLTPSLSKFHAVRLSGSSGCLLFLNWLLSFFWLYEEAKLFHQCLHLGHNSKISCEVTFF